LAQAGIPVLDISKYTEFPEIMDGRVKTLHPKIFAGILCRFDRDDDWVVLEDHGIQTFELVVVNLYPFAQTIAKPGVTRDEAVEQIDIGGPSLVRAAAKNHKFITIATGPEQYGQILSQIEQDQRTTLPLREQLMADAYRHTADYDHVIANYFAAPSTGHSAATNASDSSAIVHAEANPSEPYPDTIQIQLQKHALLRYGENPHQSAAVYRNVGDSSKNLVNGKQLCGKELSYNNLLDLDSALSIVRSFPDPTTVVIKHNNPCGAASNEQLLESVRRAIEGDPVSAFGSIIGFNRPVDVDTAEYLCTPGLFVEAIVAPSFHPEAVVRLTTKPKWKGNVRLVEIGEFTRAHATPSLRQIDGGFLIQEDDSQAEDETGWQIVTDAKPTAALMSEMRFGWGIVRHVKSNAITVSNGRALCGVGAGQMSRIDSVNLAISKAGERAHGAVLASDAFFPFPDSIEIAARANIGAIIQPGGSKNDFQVIEACDRYGIPMIFTGRRHFKH
jgi:phosphoribosylaminoimidazolecarboxamide formyltransferase / IMP cyclohydrolase